MVQSDHLWRQAFLQRWSDCKPLQQLAPTSWREEYGQRVRRLGPWRQRRDRQVAAFKLQFAGSQILLARLERLEGAWRLRLVSEQAVAVARIEREARLNRSVSFWPRELQATAAAAASSAGSSVAIGFGDGSVRVYSAGIPHSVTSKPSGPVLRGDNPYPVTELLHAHGVWLSLHQPPSQGCSQLIRWSTPPQSWAQARGIQWWSTVADKPDRLLFCLSDGRLFDGDRLIYTLPPLSQLLQLYGQGDSTFVCYQIHERVIFQVIKANGSVSELTLPDHLPIKSVHWPQSELLLPVKPAILVDVHDDLWLMLPEGRLQRLAATGGSAPIHSVWLDACLLIMLRGRKLAVYDACDWQLLLLDTIPPFIRHLVKQQAQRRQGESWRPPRLLQCTEEGQILMQLTPTLVMLWNYGPACTALLPPSQASAARRSSRDSRAQLSRQLEDDLAEWQQDRELEAHVDRKREQYNLANLNDQDLLELAKRISLDGRTPDPSRPGTPANLDEEEEYQLRLAMALSLSLEK